MSYKVEVIADSSGEWVGNQLRFSTKAAADEYGTGLFRRWTSVREVRVVESSDAVTHTLDVDGRLIPVDRERTP